MQQSTRLRACLALTSSWTLVLSASAQVNVLTAHNDNARTGLNANEAILTPITVSSNGFGKIFTLPVDGHVFTQPLYVSALSIPGKGVHDVVFVGTMHDSVYAFDAHRPGPPLWKTSFINPAAGITPSLPADATSPGQFDCTTFVVEIGIVGTPVIDLAGSTLYVVARTKEPLPPPNQNIVTQYHRLHALDIATGAERPYSPVIIDGTVPGTGAENVGGFIHFNQRKSIQRASLLLANGIVYVAFCSYCDLDPYHGWIMSYDAHTFQQVSVLNTTPNAGRGGIWMGGAGLAAAPDNSIYCVTGNGTFDAGSNPTNFGDSFLKLASGTNLTVMDYFTPYNQATMDSQDEDLGSSGVIVLPDFVGTISHPHLLVGCSKLGKLYLIDRDNMGHYNALNDNQIVQAVNMFSLQSYSPHFFGLPAFFNNRLYVQGLGEYLKAYAFTNGALDMNPVSQANETVGFRGATPGVSANGTNNGIVWQLTPTAFANPAFRAYNAENLSQKLYDSWLSSQAGLPDVISFVKFITPTIANGKVYLGGLGELNVFGLRTIFKSATRNQASGNIHLVYTGPAGITLTVQASSDLQTWTDLGTGTPTGNGVFAFDDLPTAGPATRFYRVR